MSTTYFVTTEIQTDKGYSREIVGNILPDFCKAQDTFRSTEPKKGGLVRLTERQVINGENINHTLYVKYSR